VKLSAKRYRFLAECPIDAVALLGKLPPGEEVAFALIRVGGSFASFEADLIVATLDLEALRAACRSVEDGHVMLQTVQPIDQYTGERDYELK